MLQRDATLGLQAAGRRADAAESATERGARALEAELARSLSKTDVERAAVVGKLREQQDEITERIKVLESAMTSYKWRTG